MKIFWIVIIGIGIIFLVIYLYYGGFKKINIHIAEQGGEMVVYDSITGDYRQSAVVMDKIYHSLLKEHRIETYKGYGKYFDNPQKVEKSKLRSEAGCIIERGDWEKIAQLPAEFKFKELPTEKYIVTEFPYKGKMSVFFSIMKVYPALNKFAAAKGIDSDGAVIEIYNIPEKKIMYRKDLNKK